MTLDHMLSTKGGGGDYEIYQDYRVWPLPVDTDSVRCAFIDCT